MAGLRLQRVWALWACVATLIVGACGSSDSGGSSGEESDTVADAGTDGDVESDSANDSDAEPVDADAIDDSAGDPADAPPLDTDDTETDPAPDVAPPDTGDAGPDGDRDTVDGDAAPDTDAALDGDEDASIVTACQGFDVVDMDSGDVLDTCDASVGEICLDGGCTSACDDAASVASDIGCLFFAVDLPNAVDTQGATDIQSLPFQLSITNPGVIDAEVTVEQDDRMPGQALPRIVVVDSVRVPAGQTRTLMLPTRDVDGTQPDGTRLRTTISPRAYRVSSSAPVTVTQYNATGFGIGADDSSRLLPVHVLGTEHVVIGWPQTIHPRAWLVPTDGFPATLTIVGTQADTTVTVRSTASFLSSPSTEGIPAGGEATYTLGAFDVLNLETDEFIVGTDSTGTEVSATAPIGVFAGNRASDVPLFERGFASCEDGTPVADGTLCCADGSPPVAPDGSCDDGTTASVEPTPPDRVCCADHLEEQLPPVVQWGTRFVAPATPPLNPPAPQPTIVRIVAGSAGAEVTLDGVPPIELEPYGWMEHVGQDPIAISATEPVLVALFQSGNQQPGQPEPETLNGDPAMTVVPAMETGRTTYRFATPEQYASHDVFVHGPADASWTLTGSSSTSCEATDVGDLDDVAHRAWRCRVPGGEHRLISDVAVTAVLCSYERYVAACAPLGMGPSPPGLDVDQDADGVPATVDVCPTVADPDQADGDGDGIGDACDADLDGDGCLDAIEVATGSDPNDVDSRIETVYVDATADPDTADGTMEAPFAEIAHAVDAACEGSTIVVGAGRYSEFEIRDSSMRIEGAGVDDTIVDIGIGTIRVLIDAVDVHLSDMTIRGGDTASVIVRGGARATLDSLVIAGSGGDGLLSQATSQVVATNLVVRDHAGLGGNLNGTIALSDSIFRDNGTQVEPPFGRAGGLAVNATGPTVLRRLRVERNIGDSGGLTIFGSATVEASDLDIIGHYSVNAHAFVVANVSESADIRDVRVVGNLSATGVGGAVVVNCTGAVTLTDMIVVGNRSFQSVGGFAISNADDTTVSNLLVTHNRGINIGAAFFGSSTGTPPTVRNATFANNIGRTSSAVFCDAPDSVTLIDGIIAFNERPPTSGTDPVELVGCSNLDHVLVLGNDTLMTPNLSDDPLFIDGPLGTHYLSQVAAGDGMDSPAVDAGSALAATLGLDSRTTRTDEVTDADSVDLGYHYTVESSDGVTDTDGDGVPDPVDNCAEVANPDQFDCDRNGIGDTCEDPLDDDDDDGIPNACDTCWDVTIPLDRSSCPAPPYDTEPLCSPGCTL